MSIAALEPTYNKVDDTSSYASPKGELGRDQFLTLLVAQLQHQDPLNPMESTEYTAQLAQFSSLEQLFNINDNLEILQGANNEAGLDNLLDYIGKEIKSEDNEIALYNGKVSAGGVYTLEQTGNVIVSIFDTQGSEIKTIYKNDQEAGVYDVDFDGRDNNGYLIPDGYYSSAVKAVDSTGSPIEVSSGTSGLVTAVTHKGGIPYLMVGDHLINPETVTEVSLTKTG